MKKIILLIAIIISTLSFGQKAIEIDGQIKVFNQLPRVWKTETGTYNGLRKADSITIYSYGFRNVVQPILTQYQKRGLIYLDTVNDFYTYTIINFTQVEIEEYDQRQLDNDVSANKIQIYKYDGQLYNTRIWDRIMRKFDNGDITNNQFEAISVIIFDATLPLELGLWKVSKSRLDAITPPTNVKMLAIFDKIKQIINDYITQNYQI